MNANDDFHYLVYSVPSNFYTVPRNSYNASETVKHTIRAFLLDTGSAMFVADDICKALSYRDASSMSAHCKRPTRLFRVSRPSGESEDLRALEEPDLYRVISSSNSPFATQFENWVYDSALPTLRGISKQTNTSKPRVIEQVTDDNFKALFDKNALLVARNTELESKNKELYHRNISLETTLSAAMPKYGSFVSLKDLMDQQVTPRNDNREPGVRKLSDYRLKALLRAHYVTYMRVKDGSTDNHMCTFYDEVAALALIKDWFMVPYTITPTGMTNDTPDNKLAYL